MTTQKKVFSSEIREHHDSLLECLVILSGLHNRPTSAASLKVGLPLHGGKFTPELFKRAAARINIDAEYISKNFKAISNDTLPCVLLLKDKDACVLTALKGKQAQVIFPGGGTKPRTISLKELEKRFVGEMI